jgi:sugar phosphate isomerase/epimerase
VKLAVSNIAWPAEADAQAFEALRAAGVDGIEVAPTRVWADWRFGDEDARALRAALARHGLAIPSLQAIVFNRPDVALFADVDARRALIAHLKRVADLARVLGAGPMVFGAPRTRDRGELGAAEAFAQAVAVFREVGEYCAAAGVCLCIEPNPPDYGCNFVTDSREGARLVREVGSPGFRLHLDAAGMHLAGEDPAAAIEDNADVLEHVHASEPHLGPFNVLQVPHGAIARALASIGWRKWVSIEMRATAHPLEDVATAVERVRDIYGTVLQ